MSRPTSEGWERWPAHKDPLTGQWLCRWCHAPLEGKQTSWCSDGCRVQVARHCDWDSARRILEQRSKGVCARCGFDTEALSAAIWAYQRIHHDAMIGGPGISKHDRNERYQLTKHWPTTTDLCRAIGKRASRWPCALWDANHILALAEGGSLCDQDNLECLCLLCHWEHTRALAGRLAKSKRITKKFHNGKF